MLLTPQKEQFIDEYLLDGDGIAAALRCGCDADTVQRVAAEWLADPRVTARIADHQYARAVTTGINDRWLRTQLLTIVERCMSPQPVRKEGSGEQLQNEQGEGVWTFDSVGATKALELLGQHIGFFARHNQQQYPHSKDNA